jgi:hypothetical protein
MPNMPTEIFNVAIAPPLGAGGEETCGERTKYVYISSDLIGLDEVVLMGEY